MLLSRSHFCGVLDRIGLDRSHLIGDERGMSINPLLRIFRLAGNAAGLYACLGTTIIVFGGVAPSANAACTTGVEVKAWTINPITGARRFLKGAALDTCGNIHGSFTAIGNQNLRFGTAICHSNCAEGYKPNQRSVQVNGIHDTKGVVASFPGRVTCVSQPSKALLYCWSSITP